MTEMQVISDVPAATHQGNKVDSDVVKGDVTGRGWKELSTSVQHNVPAQLTR